MADDFDQELRTRLALIEDPAYVDPASADLPARELVLLAVVSLLVVITMVAWSYPA